MVTAFLRFGCFCWWRQVGAAGLNLKQRCWYLESLWVRQQFHMLCEVKQDIPKISPQKRKEKKRQGSEGAIKCKDVPWRFTIWRCSGFPIPRLTCLLQKIREAESNNPSAQTTSGHCWNGVAAPQQPHPTRSLAGNWQPRCLHQPQGRRAEWASVARTKQQPFRMQSGSQSPLIVQSTKLILAVWNQSPSPRRSGITHDLLLGATLARSRAARTSSAQTASAHCRVRACAPASLP